MARSQTPLIEDTLAFLNCLLLQMAREDGGFYQANGFFFFNEKKVGPEFALAQEHLHHCIL